MLPLFGSRQPESVAEESDRDMRLLDTAVGPRARHLINYAPRRIGVANAIRKFKLGRQDCNDNMEFAPVDLLSAEGDERFAEFVKGVIRDTCGRPPEAFVIECRRPPRRARRGRC